MQFEEETKKSIKGLQKDFTNVKTFAMRRLRQTNLRSITSEEVSQLATVRRVTL